MKLTYSIQNVHARNMHIGTYIDSYLNAFTHVKINDKFVIRQEIVILTINIIYKFISLFQEFLPTLKYAKSQFI